MSYENQLDFMDLKLSSNLRLGLLIFLSLFITISACKKDKPMGPGNPNYDGIEGEWQSSGQNISAFLTSFSGIDSVYAKFDANFSYRIEHFDSAGVKTLYSGTFQQMENDSTDHFQVLFTQSVPSAILREGIAAVYLAQPDSLYLEIVQTTPYIGVLPPTVAGGFGSSSEGALGRTNIQKFRRIEQ